MSDIPQASLVLYKGRPARVTATGDKIAIELPDGGEKRVRPKDIVPLHPGPAPAPGDLTEADPAATAPDGALDEARQLLAGETTTLPELAELAFDAFTPATAWATWQAVADGLLFSGAREAVAVHDDEAVAAERARRHEKAEAAEEWNGLIARLREGRHETEDVKALAEVERVALGTSQHSRILRELELAEEPEAAHRLLLRVGYWEHDNPHPRRFGAPEGAPELEVPTPSETGRRDLTHLTALAIDDEGNQDPDDAISVDGDWLWIHVADAGAVASPDDALDRTARERGATLYLPEGIAPMLPGAAVERLGLGLASESPALSFGVRLDADGTITDFEVTPSRVRVTRLSYGEADQRLDAAPLADLRRLTDRFQARRAAAGATFISIPEVSVKVRDGVVSLRPLPPLTSRQLVTEAMLLTGEAAARFAQTEGLAFPYSTQPPPETRPEGDDLASQFALRRQMRPARLRSAPEPHAGVGLAQYTQVTSPLRRYLDLVAHQQIRAHLGGGTPLGQEALLERVAAFDAVVGGLRRSERLSNQHWKLVWLLQHPEWEGAGVVVELGERKSRIFIPELGLETMMKLPGGTELNDELTLRVAGVDLPALEARFRYR
ncbi:MAG: RNB domain-containing ribonuclease [Pseudomonadota bacterium]